MRFLLSRTRRLLISLALVAALVIAGSAAALADSPSVGYRQVAVDRFGRSVALHVEELGRGSPIVLLHGLGGSTYVWRFVLPALARDHRVIAIDLKGFGRSDKPFDDGYSVRDQASLVLDLLARRNVTNATLVGHSFGGVVALVAALDDRDQPRRRIRRLVLLNAPAFPQAPSPTVMMLQMPVLPYIVLTAVPAEVQATIALFTEAIGMDHITAHDVKFYAAPLREAGGRHALIETARLLQAHGNEGIIAHYRRVTVPATVVACRNDATIPLSTAYRLARTLPQARLRVIEGCDHIPPEQTPEQVIDIIRQG